MEKVNINGMKFWKSHIAVLEVRLPNENAKDGEPTGCVFRFEVSPEVKNPNAAFGKAIEDYIEEQKQQYGEDAEVTVDDICNLEDDYFEKHGLYRCTSEIPAQGFYEEKPREIDRIFNLVIEDTSSLNPRIWVMTFKLSADVTDPEQAVRKAVRAFVLSGCEEAEAALEYADGSFNWGDVMASVPDSYFERFGLTPLSRKETVDVSVNHDEILV